jgi:hypothetical protein
MDDWNPVLLLDCCIHGQTYVQITYLKFSYFFPITESTVRVKLNYFEVEAKKWVDGTWRCVKCQDHP